MNETANQNTLMRSLADSHTAGLRVVVEKCDDRETARRLYVELRRFEKQLAVKFGFGVMPKECADRAEVG